MTQKLNGILLLENHYITDSSEHENEESTFRLLQLILACAVNCDNKQTYIQTIMGMEETVQQAIMEAIQQLMSTRLSMSDTMDYEDRVSLSWKF
ncbi:unnamed protein product [Schistosoma curassoni]|uniref:HOOK_N domain-containing protein n=1 Tax=Schistosoma curassoni TaxID=6186 RepID=A0A183KM62_9TREM|nr:unnamed protein product [Schistosoma curassoni]